MNEPAILLQIGLRIAALSLVAVGGGNALIPALHDQAVESMHWLGERSFAESVVLAQAMPGPNMLLIPLIGWEVAGIPGALVSLVAFLVPSSIIAILGTRLLMRHEGQPSIAAFTWALRPVTAGLMLSSGLILIKTAYRSWPVSSPMLIPLLTAGALIVALLSLRTKLNPLVWLAAAALIGALV